MMDARAVAMGVGCARISCLLMPFALACSTARQPEPTQPSSPHPDSGFAPLPPLDDAAAMQPLPPCEGGSATEREARIDDLEDGNGLILQIDGRNGRWSVDNDGTGAQSPPVGATLLPDPAQVDAGEAYALHTFGSSFSDWGAALGFAFHVDMGALCLYDATLYQGLTFSVRGAGQLRFEVAVPETLPVADGGRCVGEGCGNWHGFPLELGSQWTRYQIAFDQLAQEPGWGQPASFVARRVIAVRFRAPAQEVFDLWLDELSFFPVINDEDAAAADGG